MKPLTDSQDARLALARCLLDAKYDVSYHLTVLIQLIQHAHFGRFRAASQTRNLMKWWPIR